MRTIQCEMKDDEIKQSTSMSKNSFCIVSLNSSNFCIKQIHYQCTYYDVELKTQHFSRKTLAFCLQIICKYNTTTD